ncbi:TonB-dependent receptor [Deminuibacter soli]|uniref:TonB-dependent receptor n=1 Tax=Deminuibacter soli TaxID=2291815 RepID=A0A3E1NII8_9BACT|nr:TonB-dependent receptor [Deminuibacter soli]RFM27745.1 TonB-dependent receptor [Deminuibacter soli]
MPRWTCLLLICLLLHVAATAQRTITITVQDKLTHEPVAAVTVKSNEQIITTGNAKGAVVLHLPDTVSTFQFTAVGYEDLEQQLQPNADNMVLLMQPDENTLNAVVVSSTRTNDRIENATTKVEVLGQEEMNEESMVKPGNIASILGDISGVQVQQSSAASGNTNIRIQGLNGQYTQLLRDGIPLYEGFSGGFGVLSIPPLDLKQLELIKGAASTLYGGGAIAGLINFISKKPAYTPEATFVASQSTLGETNINGYYAQRWKQAGFTLFAGQTFQQQKDVDKDGLSDVPDINSTLIHPTLFFYPTDNSYVSIGWSGSFEKRKGGDMEVLHGKADSVHTYFENNKLSRNTFTFIAGNRFSSRVSATLKGSYSLFHRDIATNTYLFNAKQQNFYTEAALAVNLPKHNINTGINITGDVFTPDAATPAPLGRFSNTTPGMFAQDTWQLFPQTKIEGGLRVDHHNDYGTFVLPRLAVFQRINSTWGIRTGFGMGYKTPNALTPQIKDYDLVDILPIGPGVRPEKSAGWNFEVNYKKEFGKGNSFFINHAFFVTQINSPVIGTEDAQGMLSFANAPKPIHTKGFDTYVQMQLHSGWEFYLGYTLTDAERTYLSQNQFMPLTPRNRAAATAVYKPNDSWRFGLEGSYNGRQYRDSDSKTPDYYFIALMAERKFGNKISLVLNCENLLDERQSKHESLYTGSITHPDFKPLWAPIDGRIINLALRIKPFAN